MKPEELELLKKYFPEASVEGVAAMFDARKFRVEIKWPRSTKLGDFRPPQRKGDICHITLNCDLHPYQMLITYVHEVAHYDVYQQYGRKAQPHGEEWKRIYKALMQPFLTTKIFPEDVLQQLNQHFQNLSASTCTDFDLMKVLKSHDERKSNKTLVDDLPENARFLAPNGMVFRRGEKLRKNYRCHCETNGKSYFVSGLLEVEVL